MPHLDFQQTKIGKKDFVQIKRLTKINKNIKKMCIKKFRLVITSGDVE